MATVPVMDTQNTISHGSIAALSALVAQLHALAWAMDQRSDPELGRVYPTLEPPAKA